MIKQIFFLIVLSIVLYSCGARLKQPFATENARIGENTSTDFGILDHIQPQEPIVVGVYKFRDQTGQYKQIENGSSWSTAITQGATTILLKSLEDSKWFTPIERENLSNLLNERQIIRSTREQYSGGDKATAGLPPLLFAGVILEGGVISYDTNILTGGAGARYFGTGASSKYREDRITIYLRAVSTSNGKILKTVYTSKTILSQAISANLFRYVDVKKLLEVEIGMTQNEPKQLAVKEAIDKAVENLTIEGIIDGLWLPEGGKAVADKVAAAYRKEVETAKNTKLYNREFRDRRSKNSIGFAGGAGKIDGDYSSVETGYNFQMNYRRMFKDPKINFNLSAGMMETEKGKSIYDDFALTLDGNLEYIILPYDNITPYVYGGIGTISDKSFENLNFKVQYGIGLEYLPVDFLGLRLYGEQNISFTDELDDLVQGKRDDYFWRFGFGVNFYLGN